MTHDLVGAACDVEVHVDEAVTTVTESKDNAVSPISGSFDQALLRRVCFDVAHHYSEVGWLRVVIRPDVDACSS